MTEDGSKKSFRNQPEEPDVGVLLQRCDNLLAELEAFRTFLQERKREQTVELRHFRTSILAERRLLEKLAESDPRSEKSVHTLRSTNLPFYLSVWIAAKASKGLLLFNKRFFWETPPSRSARRYAKPKKRYALVDIVADDGAEWIKVSTITGTRILFEKAKAAWENDAGAWSDDSEDEEDGGKVNAYAREGEKAVPSLPSGPTASDSESESDDGRVELLKTAFDLQRASRCAFVRYRHPRIRFVLPKIHEGTCSEVDAILDSVRGTGATVQCANDLPTSQSLGYDTSCNTLEPAFENLLIDPHAYLSSTLNVDCTILLALVSDLSHAKVEPEPRLHRAIKRQIDLEAKEQLLPTSLWPAMRSRTLLCTALAAKRMREIVEQIGTPAERARTELLLGEGDLGKGKLRDQLIENFQTFSMHPVPEDWELPIKVVEGEADLEKLPKVATKVWEELTDINRSVFLWGWAMDYTTISSNRTVEKLVKGIVEGNSNEGEDEEVEGPKIWLCGTARSLVGKEKGRAE